MVYKVLKPRIKRRRVFIPSPTRCESPPTTSKTSSALPSTSTSGNQNEVTSQQPSVALPPPPGAFDVDMIEAINLLEGHEGRGINPLEALLGTGSSIQKG